MMLKNFICKRCGSCCNPPRLYKLDIERIKMKYGDKLCLMGNVDLDYLLPHGKPEEIEEKVKWLIGVIAKDGGYILSTCNILTKDVPPENALAMYQSAEKYGRY